MACRVLIAQVLHPVDEEPAKGLLIRCGLSSSLLACAKVVADRSGDAAPPLLIGGEGMDGCRNRTIALLVVLMAWSLPTQAAEKVIFDTDFSTIGDDGQAFVMLA